MSELFTMTHKDSIHVRKPGQGRRSMRRYRRLYLWGALTLIVTGAILAITWHLEMDHRADCDASGGTVVHIRDGRGGWFCLPPERR